MQNLEGEYFMDKEKLILELPSEDIDMIIDTLDRYADIQINAGILDKGYQLDRICDEVKDMRERDNSIKETSKNSYEEMSDKELSEIIKDIFEAREKGTYAKSLISYAKKLQEELSLKTLPLYSLYDMAYYDFVTVIMKRFMENVSKLEK